MEKAPDWIPQAVLYGFWFLIALAVCGTLLTCTVTDHQDVALELVKTLGLVVGSGAGGYGIAKATKSGKPVDRETAVR
jgi:hypothetical protein